MTIHGKIGFDFEHFFYVNDDLLNKVRGEPIDKEMEFKLNSLLNTWKDEVLQQYKDVDNLEFITHLKRSNDYDERKNIEIIIRVIAASDNTIYETVYIVS